MVLAKREKAKKMLRARFVNGVGRADAVKDVSRHLSYTLDYLERLVDEVIKEERERRKQKTLS